MVSAQELAFLIFIGMLFALFMGSGIVFLSKKNQRIQDLTDQLIKETEEKKELEKLEVAITTQEKERSEIARLLHDDVGDDDPGSHGCSESRNRYPETGGHGSVQYHRIGTDGQCHRRQVIPPEDDIPGQPHPAG